MAVSKLATYKSFTSHRSLGRGGHKVTAIAIHHMAGNLSVEQCGRVFHNNQVSAHYGVNGNKIGAYVDEKNTAWAMGVFSWNQRTISIEMANCKGAPNWEVADETIETTIKLVADIAYRIGWTYIAYDGTLKGSDVIAHKWVASTACPGPYASKKLKYIATEADKLLKKKRLAKHYSGAYPVLPARGYFRISSKGKQVKRVQHLVGWVIGKSLDCDGIYGTETKKYVELAQKKLGVKQTGLFGRATLKACKNYKR